LFTDIWLRCRTAAVIAVCTVGMLAGVLLSGGTVAAQAAPSAKTSAPARIPWSNVGAGWELVQYTTISAALQSTTTLYLVGPTGAKYALRTSRNEQFNLVAWSGDKTRALLYDNAAGTVGQLNLMTGKLTTFAIGGQASPIGYTLPSGQNILALQSHGSSFALARYSLSGKLLKVLLRSKWAAFGDAYAPDGATLAVADSTGVQLVSNVGRVIRQFDVPGTDPGVGCWPERWWNAGTILAGCIATSSNSEPRLWLLPVDGARPTALTPQRKAGHDLGDFDAWRLKSGLYLQSEGACGETEINRQAANGSVTPVNVPGTPNLDNVILTAVGPRLLIEPEGACRPTYDGLLWYNPATHAEQWLFRYSPVATPPDVIPFNSTENGPGVVY
jgi:hypothetical protein